jgi:hypothetical protein
MKVGELYEVRHKWMLPRSTSNFWQNCGPVLYLGEDVIEREDGTKIVNHAVFVKGQRVILDNSFLKFLELADASVS